MNPKIATVLAQVRAQRAQLDAIEAQLVALGEDAGEASDLLGEEDLVPKYFRTARVLRDAIRAGLAASRSGRAIIVRRADLEAYLEERRAKPRVATTARTSGAENAAAAAVGRAGWSVVRGGK